MFVKSVRFKITLLYIMLLVLMISFFSIVLYQRQRQKLFESLDDLLQTRALGIADAIDTYWEVEKIEAKKDGLSMDMMSKINNINFMKIAQRWLHEESSSPDLLDILVQVLDAGGNIIANSKNIPRTIIFSEKVFNEAMQGSSGFGTFSVNFTAETPTSLRAFITPVFENGKVAYIVQVASPITKIQSALRNLKGVLFVLLPVTVFFTGIIGLLLANFTLQPVDRMTKTVRKIRADNLQDRVLIPEAKDEMQRLAITFNDMLDRIEEAFSSQKRFLQDASHELKTPLTILKGEIEVTLKKDRSVEEYKSILGSCLEEIDRTTKIVENLLMLAELDGNEIFLEYQQFDICGLLQDIVEDITVLARKKDIDIKLTAQKSVPVYGDKNQLKQVFLNLLDNAVKYTPGPGQIVIEVDRRNNEALIEIDDTGAGIPEDQLPHIFDRFYRTDKSRSSTGFGLGLSITKSIVVAHKGIIAITSSPGKGTTVKVSLPLYKQAD